jgi:predicted nucleic acid-binding protein
MSLLVDTSVWSLALRRDAPPDVSEVRALRLALAGGDMVATTGVILQELLQGIVPERVRAQISETFAVLEYLTPSRDDHVAAAGVRNVLRSAGVQVGTIDALIAHLAVAGHHTLLTTDKDFHRAADHIDLRVWQARPGGSSVRR